jgi:hypothetical protein
LLLSPAERIVLVQAWALLVVVALCLRALPFALVTRAARCVRPRRGGADGISPGRIASLVEVAARYAPVDATCLTEAIVLSWLLGRRGVATSLRIGVARPDGGLRAHAWLECGGDVILGDGAREAYEPLLGPRAAAP